MIRCIVLCMSLAVASACAPSSPDRDGDAGVEGGAATGPMANAEALMRADRDFSAAVAAGGAEAWTSWFAEDGAMIQPGVGEIRGKEAIHTQMAGLDEPGVSLTWEPARADIARSGDLGWTTGSYVSEGPGPEGEARRGQGRYVSIWRLQPDGSWRVVMDLGNPTAPAGG